MKCLAEVKDSLDIEVKQNFIDPLQSLCDKDLKEIQVCLLSTPYSPQGSHMAPSFSEPLPILGPCSAYLCAYMLRAGLQGIGGPCNDPCPAPSTT